MSNTEDADVIITDNKTYNQVMNGKTVTVTWPELAAEIFPKMQQELPELRSMSLEDFIKYYPAPMEIVEEDEVVQ